MKRLFCIILSLTLLLSCVLPARAAEENEVINVKIANEILGDYMAADIRNVDGEAYIQAMDLQYLFNLPVDTDQGYPVVTYRKEEISLTDCYTDQSGILWVPLAGSLEKIDLEVQTAGDMLMIFGKPGAIEDLYAMTDEIMYDPIGRFKITSSTSKSGIAGVFCALIYNTFMEADIIGNITGQTNTDLYKEALTLIMTKDDKEDITELIAFSAEQNSKFNSLSQVFNNIYDIGLLDQELMNSIYLGYGDTFSTFLMEYKNLNEGLGIAGLDGESQLKVLSYIYSLANASTYYVDMVENTLLDAPNYPQIYFSPYMKSAAETLVNYYRSEDWADVFLEMAKEEAHTIALAAGNNFFATPVMMLMQADAQISSYVISGLLQCFGFDAPEEAMHNLQVDFCLAEFQKILEELYVWYRRQDKPLKAKQAALLYLRCSEAWSYVYEGSVEEADFAGHRKAIQKQMTRLETISDRWLNTDVHNEEILFDSLLVKSPAPPEETAPSTPVYESKWENLVEYSTDNGPVSMLHTIYFFPDGAMSLSSGLPHTDLGNFYDGTYRNLTGNLYEITLTEFIMDAGLFEEPETITIQVRLDIRGSTMQVEYVDGSVLGAFIDGDRTYDLITGDSSYLDEAEANQENDDSVDKKILSDNRMSGTWTFKIPEEYGTYYYFADIRDNGYVCFTGGESKDALEDEFIGTCHKLYDGLYQFQLYGYGRATPEPKEYIFTVNFYTNQSNTRLWIDIQEGDPIWHFWDISPVYQRTE